MKLSFIFQRIVRLHRKRSNQLTVRVYLVSAYSSKSKHYFLMVLSINQVRIYWFQVDLNWITYFVKEENYVAKRLFMLSHHENKLFLMFALGGGGCWRWCCISTFIPYTLRCIISSNKSLKGFIELVIFSKNQIVGFPLRT